MVFLGAMTGSGESVLGALTMLPLLLLFCADDEDEDGGAMLRLLKVF